MPARRAADLWHWADCQGKAVTRTIEAATGPSGVAIPGRVPDAAHFVRSVFKFGVAQGFSWIGAAVLAVMLPRLLGDVNLGKLGFALGLTLLAGLLANLGTSTFLVKEVARSPERAGELTVTALALRLPLSLLAAALAVIAVTLTRSDPATRATVYMLSLGILVDASRGVVQGTLQGLQRLTTLAAFPAISTSVYAGAAVLALTHGAGIVVVAAAYVVGQLAGLAVSGAALWRALPALPRPRPRLLLLLLAGGLPFFVWQAALLVYGQVDSVLLSFLTNDAVVGWYVAAYRIVTVPMFVPTILMTVIFPALSAASAAPERFDHILRRALQVALQVTLPMALGVMLLPDRIVATLGYPPGFDHSILPIVLLAPSFPLVAVDMIIGTALNARDRQRQWALVAVAAAVLNPALNLVAIPLTQAWLANGAIGAAAVTTATEVFLMTVGLRLLPRGALDRATAWGCSRIVVAGLVMAAVVVLLRGASLLVSVPIGAVTYTAASLALRTLSLADLRLAFRYLVSGRPPQPERVEVR